MHRRTFFTALVAPGALLAKKKTAFDTPLAVQLYTVRDIFPNDPAGVIAALAKIGYKEAEILAANIDQVMPLLKANGIAAPSGHFDTGLITGATTSSTWQAAVDQAHKYGLRYMVMPYLAPALRGDLDGYRALADKMNRAAELTAKAGMQFCYHNHAFEFAGAPGARPWDIFLTRCDPKLVQYEVDLFWVSVAGNSASELVRTMAGRVPLVHVKDMAFGTPTQFNENVRPEAFREAGTGTLDMPAILAACHAAGVQHYIVEQDHTKGNPIDSLRVSYHNLRKMKVG